MSQISLCGDSVLINSTEVLAKIAVTMHNDVIDFADQFFDELKRKYYITPTSYLELLKTYLKMFSENKSLIPFSIKRYTVGLEKLKDTNEQIVGLQEKIKKFEPILAQKAKENEEMKIVLEEQNRVAQEVERVVSQDAEKAQSRFPSPRNERRSQRNENDLRRRNRTRRTCAQGSSACGCLDKPIRYHRNQGSQQPHAGHEQSGRRTGDDIRHERDLG